MARGRRHFGSVRRLPSGWWQASYWHNGKRHTASRTFRTRADASAWLATVEADVTRGLWVDPAGGRLTVGELGDRWLASNPAKRPNTRAMDETVLRVHLATLQERPIASITQPEVQALVNTWADSAAPRTVRRRYAVLAALFAYAVRSDWLGRSPCRNVNLPAVTTTRRRLLTDDDVDRLAEAIAPRYRAMVWLGAILGLRWSEVAGLRVRAVDLLSGTLVVAETVLRDGKGRAVVGAPKSSASGRTFPLAPALIDLLAEHLAARGLTAAEGDTWIFEAPGGGPLSYSHWRNRVWLPAVRIAGCKGAGFHDLRRANATAMVLEGVDMKTAQTRLGHSDPRLTLAVYAQASSDADRAASAVLTDRFLRPSRTQRARGGS